MRKKLRVILLSSAFNGLTQRAWLEIKNKGHDVSFQLFTNEEDVIATVEERQPDIVICPFLKDRVPEALWQNKACPVIIIHPGIMGDRGASALDWSIMNSMKYWGVTALQAVDEMDAGPIWASHEFPMPKNIRKSVLYNSLVNDAAMQCIEDVLDAFIEGKQPIPLDYSNPIIKGTLQPNMKQSDRHIGWNMTSSQIIRKINAAEGVPGVLVTLENKLFYVYDAHFDKAQGTPGKILAKRDGAILVGTGDASVWIGALKCCAQDNAQKFKVPAINLLKSEQLQLADLSCDLEHKHFALDEYNEIHYEQFGKVGVFTFEYYNGAMSTAQCYRMRDALKYAKKQDTTVLIIKGGINAFSNGIHLNTIEAADNPAEEAWLNIQAIDDVCLEILTAKQWTIASITGSSGAGGVMLALTADQVIAREGTVLNPHYATMGLYGSEYWTYTLPKRVGAETADYLTKSCLPISTEQALIFGMIDDIGPRNFDEFNRHVLNVATEAVSNNMLAHKKAFDAKKAQACRDHELHEMKEDLLHNRNQFAEKRRCFVFKGKASKTPARLVTSWTDERGGVLYGAEKSKVTPSPIVGTL